LTARSGSTRTEPSENSGPRSPFQVQNVAEDIEELDLVGRWKTGEFGTIELVRRLEDLSIRKRSEAVVQ